MDYSYSVGETQTCYLTHYPYGFADATISNILVTSGVSRTSFVVTDQSMTWSDGNAYCSDKYGSSLATITGDEEAQLLLDLTDTGVDAWIGLNKLDGHWAWASGYACDDDDCSSLPYWISGQPSGGPFVKRACRAPAPEGNSVGDYGGHNGQPKTLEECKALCLAQTECKSFVFSESGQKCHLKDKVVTEEGGCADGSSWNFETYYLVQEPTIDPTSVPTKVPTPSPTNSQYVVTDASLSWSDANDYCLEQYGTSLATITNDEDAQKLLDFYTDTGVDVWIGLNTLNGNWEWASGYPCDDRDCSALPYWISGQPDNKAGIQDCAWIGWNVGGIHSMVDDTGCGAKRGVVCDFATPTSIILSTDVLLDIEGPLKTSGAAIGSFVGAEEMHYEMDVVIDSKPVRYEGLFYCKSTMGTYLQMPVLFINADASPDLFVEYKMYGWNPEHSQYFSTTSSSEQTLGGGTGHSVNIGESFHVEIEVAASTGTVYIDGEQVAQTQLMDYSYSVGETQTCYLTHYPYGFADATISNILLTSGVSRTSFVVTDRSMNWSDGNAYCSDKYGSALATITDDEEAQLLLDLTDTGVDAWIGLNKLDGDWAWASGYACEDGDCSTLAYWIPGQPSGTGADQDCAWIGWGSNLGVHKLVDDTGCYTNKRVVCDIPNNMW